jgi:hypothetical protein
MCWPGSKEYDSRARILNKIFLASMAPLRTHMRMRRLVPWALRCLGRLGLPTMCRRNSMAQ